MEHARLSSGRRNHSDGLVNSIRCPPGDSSLVVVIEDFKLAGVERGGWARQFRDWKERDKIDELEL